MKETKTTEDWLKLHKKLTKKDVADTLPDLVTYIMSGKISLKEAKFIACYISNGFNAGRAWFDACSPKALRKNTCYTKGSLLLKKEEIRKALTLYMQTWLDEKKGKLERLLVGRLSNMAFYDPSMFIDEEGAPAFKSWADIPEDFRCCVDGIEKKYHGKDADISTITITLVDRKWAMKELLNYMNLAGIKVDMDLGLDQSAQDLFKEVFASGVANHNKAKTSSVGAKAKIPESTLPRD